MKRDVILAQYRAIEHDLQQQTASLQFSASINLRLERITHLLHLLGDPHRTFPSIHITGTSGKTSTSTMTAAVLTQSGYKTGLHVSPYLQVINEGFQINNRMAPTSHLATITERIKPAIAEVTRDNPFGQPSYFEAKVAMAFCLFQEEQVDVAVVEVGLGGTLDATNVLPAHVAVLTNVGLDHTAILGDTVEQIAQDKAGIIKPGQIVVSGVSQPSVRQIVADRCAEQGATLWQRGEQFSYQQHDADNSLIMVVGNTVYNGLRLGMQGAFQAANATCAIAAVQAFVGEVAVSAVHEGLRQARVPGRMELMQHHPVIIIDGAHNPDKMRAAAQTIDASYGGRRRIVVVALKSDKDYQEVLRVALGGASVAIMTAFHISGPWKSFAPDMLAEAATAMMPDLDVRVVPDPIQAVQQALAMANPNDLIWITGSLYLVGNVREHWHSSDELIIQIETEATASHQ